MSGLSSIKTAGQQRQTAAAAAVAARAAQRWQQEQKKLRAASCRLPSSSCRMQQQERQSRCSCPASPRTPPMLSNTHSSLMVMEGDTLVGLRRGVEGRRAAWQCSPATRSPATAAVQGGGTCLRPQPLASCSCRPQLRGCPRGCPSMCAPEGWVHSPQVAGLQAVGADQVAPPHIHTPRLARLVYAQRLCGRAGGASSTQSRERQLASCTAAAGAAKRRAWLLPAAIQNRPANCTSSGGKRTQLPRRRAVPH